MYPPQLARFLRSFTFTEQGDFNMLIELTKEQLSALEMLSNIGDYYIDDIEPSNPQYDDDKETITQAQDVIQQIQQQFLKGA